MKIANVKSMVIKGVTVGLLAGAVVLAAPKAEAQVVVAAGFGAPYYGSNYGRAAYYERLRIEEARRHAEWVRAHERDRYSYGYRR